MNGLILESCDAMPLCLPVPSVEVPLSKRTRLSGCEAGRGPAPPIHLGAGGIRLGRWSGLAGDGGR